MTSLEGQVAVISGASSGIGRSFARTLSAAGMRLCLIGRSQERLDQVSASLPTENFVHAADVSTPGTASDAVARTLARFGRLDVVMPNAGLYLGGDFADSDLDAIHQIINVNVFGAMSLTHAALPHLVEQGSGDILVTSSVSGHQAIHWEPVYSASKHAVQAFVHGLRRQLVGSGVRVGAIAPGIVLNELWSVSPDDTDDIEAQVASGAGITSEDVAEAALFMLTRPRHVTIRDLVILPAAQRI